MAEYSKKIVKGTITVLIFTFLSALLGYVLKFVFARYLQVEEIGLFYSVLGFILFFAFIRDLGLSDSLTYFIPRFKVDNKKKNIKSAILFTLYIQMAIGILFAVVFVALSNTLVKYYFKDERALFLILGLAFYFVIEGIYEVLFQSFQGFQDMFLFQGLEFSFQVISLAFFLVFIFAKIPITYFAIVYLISMIISTTIFFVLFVKKLFPDFFYIKTKISKKLKKEMLEYSFPTMMGSLAGTIFSQQSVFFLTFFVGLEAVGYYVMAHALAKISIFFFKAVNFVFSPIMSEMWKKKDIKSLNYYFNEMITYTYVVGVPMVLALVVFPQEILRILYSDSFLPASQALMLLAFYYPFFSFNSLFKRAFLSAGMPKLARNATYATLIVNLVFNIVLIPTYGLLGAVIADIVSIAITTIYVLYLNHKHLSILIDKNKLVRVIVASTLFIISAAVLKHIINMPIILELILVLIIAGGTYIGAIFALGIISFKKIIFVLDLITNKKFRHYFLKEEKVPIKDTPK
ncbi:Polysaccharide biosynthesis protein [archaeon GW2011_AR15]|nr:Polysaccharide biosynthesis protein [archaeon GW2011_AR15]